MKQITCALLGYGDRTSRYAEYAVTHPDELKIVAVIDVLPHKVAAAKKKFALDDGQTFESLAEFLSADVKCDVVINGTMDQMHYETTVPLLEKGYNVLLEKPITANAEELLHIESLAKQNGCKVVVCHVLRYTPFYAKIKEVLSTGKLGKIVDMQLNEHVWHGHFVNAYVRGKWRNEKECGSGLLLAKCCHDTDLMCWLNNQTKPKKVSSFGSRNTFAPHNAPAGATEYCYTCPHRETCVFDADKFEREKDFIPFYTWAGLKKPLEQITEEEKKAFLKTDVYGKCVYNTDMDIVDRQSVSVEFENGSVATLHVVGGTSKAGRHIHVICEFGEIIGYIEENKLTIRTFDRKEITHADEVIDFDKAALEGEKDNSIAGHYGGDYYIMRDLVRYLAGEQTSGSTTVIEDSVNSHLICYAAEKSRKQGVVVDLHTEYPRG